MTSFTLKIIAVIAMTADHTARIIGPMGLFPGLPLKTSYFLIQLMEGIGRMAFPLFAFLAAEGAEKTRSMPRYIGRLVLFAVISEPVFYYALGSEGTTLDGFLGDLSRLNFGNVFFTLALAAAAIYAWQLLERRGAGSRILFLPICLAALLAGGYIGCDYGMAGVLLIVALYLAETKNQKYAVILIWTVCFYGLGQACNPIGGVILNGFFAGLACVPVGLYNGQRGRPVKWGFYAYYPAHLLALSLLRSAVK